MTDATGCGKARISVREARAFAVPYGDSAVGERLHPVQGMTCLRKARWSLVELGWGSLGHAPCRGVRGREASPNRQ
ncbi:hypothetical protein GCM10022206_17470 [Streptomyces chiangmaiensis]